MRLKQVFPRDCDNTCPPMCFVDNVTVTRIFFPSIYILEKKEKMRQGDKYAKPSFLKLQGIEYTHTRLANTLVLTPPGQTLLAMELIIHNRCSEMFSRIYDGAQRNSQVSLWCCFLFCPTRTRDCTERGCQHNHSLPQKHSLSL